MRPASYRWNLAALSAIDPVPAGTGPYSSFAQIDGSHPWKFAVPNGFIDYPARVLRGTKIVYFNFALAKEMGLLPQEHKQRVSPELERAVVEAFALRILNEYDQLTGLAVPRRDLKPNRYMATRYLQLQHHLKNGATSGDGRSVWNGQFVSNTGVAWDLSSCGTGVTRLSPAFAISGRPLRTGDPKASYGSGLADIDEGLSAAILSESLHRRGILTERTLVVLEAPSGHGITVRAAKNLLRPSHLFLHLKQGNQLMLKRALDFYLTKQAHNREISPARDGDRYAEFLLRLARQYGEFAARLEDEYIFHWLDWDGDNMLLDGGIIDYGSIRQFGLCHHRYRYDDVERFSTSLREQRTKARYLVQIFVQLVDFVRTGAKRHHRHFANAPELAEFDATFTRTRTDSFLRRLGLSRRQRESCLAERGELVCELERAYRFFERRESQRGLRRVPDGVNNPAVFCARTLLRELPRSLLLRGRALETREFLELLRTPNLTKKELRSPHYDIPAVRFQRLYLELLRFSHKGRSFSRALLETAMRAGDQNHTHYVTGDGILHVVNHLLAQRRRVSRNEFQAVIEDFVRVQQGLPVKARLRKNARRLLDQVLELAAESRFGI